MKPEITKVHTTYKTALSIVLHKNKNELRKKKRSKDLRAKSSRGMRVQDGPLRDRGDFPHNTDLYHQLTSIADSK